MNIEIRPLHTTAERREAFSLRYREYILGNKDQDPSADKDNGILTDSLDQYAILLGAFDRQRLVGTVRGNIGGPSLSDYAKRYAMHTYSPCNPRLCSLTSRLVIDGEHRSGMLAVRMSKAMFIEYRNRGVRFDFIDCQSHMLPFFSRLGYIQHQSAFFSDVTRQQHFPMVLDMQDYAGLAEKRSPFAALLAPDLAPTGLAA